MIVEVDGTKFDNNLYDRAADVLYLHVGDAATAVDWDETPEGVHTRWGPNGELVGLTIVNARGLLERGGRIVVTLPDRRLEIADLGDLLVAA
jgi:uncharacterized protein YuzE